MRKGRECVEEIEQLIGALRLTNQKVGLPSPRALTDPFFNHLVGPSSNIFSILLLYYHYHYLL